MRSLVSQARRFLRGRVAPLFCAAALLLAAAPVLQAASPPAGAANVPPTPPVMLLTDRMDILDSSMALQAWRDAPGTASIDSVVAAQGRGFLPTARETVFRMGASENLWLRLRLQKPADATLNWLLIFPVPLLDRITLYQQNSAGQWLAQTAGDTTANADWPERGRYPQFHLALGAGQTKDIYLRLHHATPITLPVALVSEATHHHRLQTEYLALGLVFGAMLLLMLACLVQSWIYQDSTYAWYSLYAGTMMLAVAAYTGVAGHLLWPRWSAWADASQGSLGILGSAAAQLFIWHLCAIGGRYRRFSAASFWIGASCMLAAVVYALVDRASVGIWVIASALILTISLGLATALLCWRRGDEVGKWVLLAYTPMALAALLALAVVLGWLNASWVAQYTVVAAMGLEVPLLLVALNLRSRARHGAQTREEALASQDALTGLLAPHLFEDRLAQVVMRYKREKDPAAVVYIDLINHDRIKGYYGAAVAEQSLLRSVIKLRRLMRDVDTISRVGEARFGLIMEGVSSRHTVMQRAAQLIAAGLMPLRGLKPQVTLQFHAAAVLLGERILEPKLLADELGKLLAGMSGRTRRPIRFLEPENTVLMPLDSLRSLDLHSDFPPHVAQ